MHHPFIQHPVTSIYNEKKSSKEKTSKRYIVEEYSLCFLTLKNPLRRSLLNLVRWRWFERIVILVIIINCIMLALYNPLDRLCRTKLCKTLEALEHFVFTFFTLEMTVKMVAMGIFGKKGYFGDKWNLLDFVIVMTGISNRTGINDSGFLTIVRLGRVLRPLRAINRVPSIRILVSLLMDTIPMLGNVLMLAFLVFSCFGIMGVQLFQGKLRNRCYFTESINFTSSHNRSSYSKFFISTTKTDFVCHLDRDHGTQSCNDIPPDYNYQSCQEHYKLYSVNPNIATNISCLDNNRFYRTCKQDGPNPYYGSVSFDNIAMAWVFIYQVVTLEGWGDLMYLMQDSYNFWVWIYFVTLISIGSFFLVNLALVVITMQFSETKRRETRIIKKQLNKMPSQLSLYTDLRNIWSKLWECFCFARNFRSVHHIHQHVHVHQQTSLYCNQCRIKNEEFLSPTSVNIPNIEITCYDDENEKQNFFFPTHRLNRSASYPGSVTSAHSYSSNSSSSEGYDQQNELSLLNTPGLRLHRSNKSRSNVSQHSSYQTQYSSNNSCNSYLFPMYSPSRSQVSTFSVEAQSIASVSINGCGPVNSKTSLSLKINSPSGECFKTNTIVGTNFSKKKTSISSDCSINTNKSMSCKTSNYSDESSSDFESTNSDIMSSSMFDLRNTNKYYVSHKPTNFQQFRIFCHKISESTKTAHIVMVVIVINTLCMAIEHHNQPFKMTLMLEYMNLIFIWIFTLEMIIKILGLGPKLYFRYGFNCFDCFIVLLSLFELLVDSGHTGNLIVFRSFRLLRIFRLVRPMRNQIAVILQTTSSVMTFFALLFLFMFTFAILGMNIFGGKFVFKDRYNQTIKSRSNFDSFFWAMVTVFQILTQEDWNLVMYDGIRATTKWATIYFILLMTIGYYVLLNLLVAILVEGFTTPLEKKRMAQRIATLLQNRNKKVDLFKRTISLPDMYKVKEQLVATKKENLLGNELNTSACLTTRYQIRRKTVGVLKFSNEHLNDETYLTDDELDKQDIDWYALTALDLETENSKKNDPILLSARSTIYRENDTLVLEWNKNVKTENGEESEEINTLNGPLKTTWAKRRKDWSLFMFSPQNRFRKSMKTLKESKYFDYFILVLIVYSCVLLALETPDLHAKSDLRSVIDTSTFVLTWVFLLEMLIKVTADGLVLNVGAYLRCGWNVLDCILVVTSFIDIIIMFSNDINHQSIELFKELRVLRASRALRPLRMIRKAPGLKLVVQTLLYSLKPIGNTVLIAGIFFAVFGILGVQLLKGSFYYCQGVAQGTVFNKTQCINHPNGYWVNYQYNFDNLFEALMSLFVVSTKDGWVDMMRRGIDARGVDLEPQVNYSPGRVLYFVSFILIGGFLVINMIVGVVVENFQRCQELQEDDKSQAMIQRWRLHMDAQNQTFWKSYAPFRLGVYKLVHHAYWDMGIAILIFVNVSIMALEHYNMSQIFHVFLDGSNIVFTIFYVIEAALLLIALGPRRYFKDKWYCFDMLIVIVSVISICLEELNMNEFNINAAAIKAMRMLRVVRVLKLLKIAKGLRFLLDHVAETIPQVTNLALLFSLLFFIYSCLGMQLFGKIECSSRYPCAGLGRHANFQSLGSSMLTLFRIATGDNWSGILKDTIRPNCDSTVNCRTNCCTSRYVAPIFFVSFVLFAQFVLVNIVIAVLMKHLRMPEEKNNKKRKRTGTEQQTMEGNKKRGLMDKLSDKVTSKLSLNTAAPDLPDSEKLKNIEKVKLRKKRKSRKNLDNSTKLTSSSQTDVETCTDLPNRDNLPNGENLPNGSNLPNMLELPNKILYHKPQLNSRQNLRKTSCPERIGIIETNRCLKTVQSFTCLDVPCNDKRYQLKMSNMADCMDPNLKSKSLILDENCINSKKRNKKLKISDNNDKKPNNSLLTPVNVENHSPFLLVKNNEVQEQYLNKTLMSPPLGVKSTHSAEDTKINIEKEVIIDRNNNKGERKSSINFKKYNVPIPKLNYTKKLSRASSCEKHNLSLENLKTEKEDFKEKLYGAESLLSFESYDVCCNNLNKDDVSIGSYVIVPQE